MLNIEEIYKILPQRYPFVMIDRVVSLEPGKKITAIKNVSYNEWFFQGHFPEQPILPGVLIIEAFAQAAIILFAAEKTIESDKKLTYYLGNTKVRFLQPVTPGDQLIITIEPLKVVAHAAIVKAQAKVKELLVAEGEIGFVAK
ncbi:MAG: 3-hydroxyacyl-ACP dehydratase FabZ [Candidatus Omnitrophota bacterium]